ncbi:hypothetical protein ACWC10_17990 [Streptomyces sp. NPDC001595]|uniref:hypothetical protein n=1 Tax=Streptomyces sp. NPDC001532 TaxID=3154520 RepID=UPI00331EADD1
MRREPPTVTRATRSTAVAVSLAALISAAALVGALAPRAAASPAALPLPLPAAGSEPLVTEGVTIEGPLINTIALPTLR